MIREIEEAIVDRLTGALPKLHVAAFPDRPDTFKMHHPAGAVLVAYGREVYGKPRDLSLVVQERRIEWDISILTRNLRTHVGAYDVLDAVRMVLTGWRTEGCSKLMPVKAEFIDQNQGVWTHILTMTHTIPTVECHEEEDLPPLKRVNTADDYGTTEAPRPDCAPAGDPEGGAEPEPSEEIING